MIQFLSIKNEKSSRLKIYLGKVSITGVNDNSAFIVVAGALSGEAHGIAGKIGWNTWGTES